MKNKSILGQEENIRIIFARLFENSVTYTLFQIKNTCFDSRQCQSQALIKRVCIYFIDRFTWFLFPLYLSQLSISPYTRSFIQYTLFTPATEHYLYIIAPFHFVFIF